ncbi:integrase [Mycobacterium phage HINdeR]|uniref:Serine integrase n=1 Tax=Mycobacterium phage HINdeR TaxID=1327770 RepID=R4JHQ1_9CAUD|nr:integrase [Mycobacterium phage HINdeR]AGK87512.1 serine integrase [Mycobacterium phage HINdeR]
MRVLGRIRLSRLSDESTSPERQREIIEGWAKSNDHTIVGWAEDLDVSGSVDPFDTPALGPWLSEPKLHEWDILCAWKLDRLSRRAIPMNKLFGWVMDHDKTLVCVNDNIDLSTWIGRMVANVIAGVAEGELEAIRERTTASHRKLRELGRWPGGRPSYGYRAVEREDAAGWVLEPDPVSSVVLRSIIDWVLQGQSVESIAKDLTAMGEVSPSDYVRQRAGEAPRGHPWHGRTIVKLLRSKTLLGYVTHNGTTVRDENGVPVQKGPPLVDQDTFNRLQAALDDGSRPKTVNRTSKASPLLGVALCWDCEKPLYSRRQTTAGKVYRYYHCRDGHTQSIPADDLQQLVEERFLNALGDQEVHEMVYLPAESHQAELEEAQIAVQELTSALGRMKSNYAQQRIHTQLEALDKRIQELEGLPTSEARSEMRPTGGLYKDAWEEADEQGRRELLIKSGITAKAKLEGRVPNQSGGALSFDLVVPEDLLARMSV